ncbi:MAG: ATP-binding protein, partial [Gemmatimonadota bacterium]|nr:ATP-binding protein [Gemmatimonadota bacterium]
KAISRTNISKASTAMRGVGRASKHKDDIGRASEALGSLQTDLQALEQEMTSELDGVREEWDAAAMEIEVVEVSPRKSDISVKRVALAWVRQE